MPELAPTWDKKSFRGSIDIPHSDLLREKQFVNSLLSTANKTKRTDIRAAILNLCAEGSALGIMPLNWLIPSPSALLQCYAKLQDFLSHFLSLSPSSRTPNHNHDSEQTSLPTSFNQPQLHHTMWPSLKLSHLNVPVFSLIILSMISRTMRKPT